MEISTISPAESTAERRFASNGHHKHNHFLLIAFDFPPRRTSGVYRPTGMTKYLARLGWQPTVLTVETRKGDLEDRSLLERIPSDVQLVRTRYFDLTRWEKPAAQAIRSGGALQPQTAKTQPTLLDRGLRRVAEFVRSCLYFPDDTTGWVPFGLARAIQLNRQHCFDLIYSTSPPRSSLVIGLLLKCFFRLPWVVELRDPWLPPQGAVRRLLEKWLLGLIVRSADAIVVVTSGHQRELMERYGITAEKVSFIPNGFDEEDFSSSALDGHRLLPPHYIHLTHFGTVYRNCSGSFFQALQEVLEECPEWRQKVRVNIIGYPDEMVQRYAAEQSLAGVIKMYGFMPHHDAIQAMRSSDCLLLFYANPNFARLAVAGKTYEYLRIGRPILAVTYDGGMKELINAGKAGWVVDPGDVTGIKCVLRAVLLGREPDGDARVRNEFVAQFRYDRLAKTLVDIFDQVCSNGR